MKFLISAGHGGGDPGNTASGRVEADICLDLRNIVVSKLRAKGHDVITDGGLSENLPLSSAIGMVVSSRVCIELHTNAGAPTAKGVEVIAKAKDAKPAKAIAQGIADMLGTTVRRDGGWFDYDKLVKEQGRTLGFVRAGGIIIEAFFQSNAQELAAYDAKKWLVAQAIVDALEAFK